MIQLPVKKADASDVSLSEVQAALSENLCECFKDVDVSLTQCPDLDRKPYDFFCKTIGRGAIFDVGGPGYLVPDPNFEKKYSFDQILGLCSVLEVPDDIIFGPCAGPFWEVGTNCEMIAGKNSNDDFSNSFVSWAYHDEDKSSKSSFKATKSNNFGILGNFFVSPQNEESTVLKVSATGRLSDLNFTQSIQKCISDSFPKKVISMGGLFVVSNSRINCHVMPNFSQERLLNSCMVNEWLKFFPFEPPMTFATVLHTHDPGLDLRMEHSHGMNENKMQLGHYHNDIDGDTVSYEGVFALADKVIRVDMPQ